MALIIEAKSVDNTMVRLGKGGKLESVEVDRSQYVEPADKEHKLRIIGRSEPFEMDGQFGLQQKLRLEFEIIKGKQIGGQFSSMFTYTVGQKSNLGEVIAAARNKPIGVGERVDVDEYLGRTLYASTRQKISATGNQYTQIAATRPDDDDDEEEAPAKPAKAAGKPTWEDDEE